MDTFKAIEILNLRALAYEKTNFPDRVKAIKLGIEALKLYQHNHHIGQHVDPDHLPREIE